MNNKKKIKEDAPKVSYYDTVLQSKDTLLATHIAKDYGMTPQKFNKTLKDLGIQYVSRKQWVLYRKYQSKGYTTMETNTYTKPNGDKGTSNQTVWTQKGRLFLYNILKENNILPSIEK